VHGGRGARAGDGAGGGWVVVVVDFDEGLVTSD
jgi:hypothetical protein